MATRSVDVKDLSLVFASQELAVSPDHDDLGDPSQHSRGNAEDAAAHHGDEVSRLVARGPEVGRPDEADIHDHGDPEQLAVSYGESR